MSGLGVRRRRRAFGPLHTAWVRSPDGQEGFAWNADGPAEPQRSDRSGGHEAVHDDGRQTENRARFADRQEIVEVFEAKSHRLRRFISSSRIRSSFHAQCPATSGHQSATCFFWPSIFSSRLTESSSFKIASNVGGRRGKDGCFKCVLLCVTRIEEKHYRFAGLPFEAERLGRLPSSLWLARAYTRLRRRSILDARDREAMRGAPSLSDDQPTAETDAPSFGQRFVNQRSATRCDAMRCDGTGRASLSQNIQQNAQERDAMCTDGTADPEPNVII
jgi:hypothetical protein